MKTILNILLTIIFTSLTMAMYSQCVQCSGGSATGNTASIIGINNTASGDASLAGGSDSQALGEESFAFGDNALAMSPFSIALGKNVMAFGGTSVVLGRFLETTISSSMAIGYGFNVDNVLRNTIANSIIFGFNSDKPTFFIGHSSGLGKTGKIGIGNVTEPQAKLHIKADTNEVAAMLIEPNSWIGANGAEIRFGNVNNAVRGQNSQGLIFRTEKNYLFASTDAKFGIGTYAPSEKLEVNGNIKQSDNFHIETEKILSTSLEGLKLFASSGTGIFIKEDGKVGINTTRPYADLDVSGKIKTKYFQIPDPDPSDSSKSIAGMILQSSDIYGNVSWISQSSIDDGDWTKSGGNIYRLGGNIGIGISDHPTAKVEVKQTISNEYAMRLFHEQTNGSNGLLIETNGGNENDILFQINSDIDGSTPRDVLFIAGDGKIGIGTDNPDEKQLRVYSSGECKIEARSEGYNEASMWVTNGGLGYGFGIDANLIGHIYGNSNSPSSIMSFYDGNVGIGTTLTSGYKLSVAGKIRATEVNVEHLDNWYDCVFEDDYNLSSVKDLEKYIEKNKHLPDVPSAKEVKENGINLGEMNGILLKKVEELTLYMIEQQKMIDNQQKEIEKLKDMIGN